MIKHCKKVLCATLACGMLLSSCASSQSQSSSVVGNSSAAGSSSAAVAGGTSDKISFMTAMAYGTNELDVVIEAFKANNQGVEIDIQHVPNETEQTLAARVNSGDIPDIFLQQTGSNAQKYSEYAYEFTNDPVVGKFKESAIEISKDAQGRLMSLPWTYESMGFIINKDIFDELGITTMPKTINDLEEICKQIQNAGYTPFSVGMKETWVLAHVASHFVAPENSDPKDIIEKIDSGELTFEKMGSFKNVFDMLDLMVKYGPAKPLEVDWELSENDLANSKAAIIHMGDWCEATLNSFNPDTNYDFMAVPVGNDSTAPTFLSSISWQFILHKDSKSLEKSKELLEFILTSDEGVKWMTEGVKAIPSVKTDAVPDGVLAAAAQGFVNNNESLPWNHTLWPSDYNNKLGAELQGYILGNSSREKVMSTLDDLWKMSR